MDTNTVTTANARLRCSGSAATLLPAYSANEWSNNLRPRMRPLSMERLESRLLFSHGRAAESVGVPDDRSPMESVVEPSEEFGHPFFARESDRPTTETTVLPIARLVTAELIEGTGDWNRQLLEFRLDRPSDVPVHFDFEALDGTAAVGEDFRARVGSVTFHPGQTVQRRAFTVRADSQVELDETVDFVFSNPRGLSLASPTTSLTLVDDDFPLLSMVTTEIVEGDETTDQSIEFRLDRPSIRPVSFRVSTFENRTVVNHKLQDFDVTLTFLPGQTVLQHEITVLGNNFDEYDTTIAVRFYEPVGLEFATDLTLLEIVDDDARPTNIIYIMLDDADYYDVGFHSSEAVTPNIDRLRAGGLELTHFYSASAVCSPTRASVLTGKNPLRFGINTIWPQESVLIQESKGLRGLPGTIPQLGTDLRETGMRTGHFGKWHVGDSRPQYGPAALGFDEWVLPLSDGDTTAPVVDSVRSHLGQEQVTSREYMTTFLTDRVVDFIDRQAAARTPFFADVWYYAPHWPWVVPPGFDNSTLNFDLETPRGRLLAMMYELDVGIGRIIDSLDRHNILDDTLLIFTSDNGGQRQARTAGGDLRGGKGGFNEAGIRVPFVAHWPNEIAANSTNESVMVTTDLLPTLLEFLGTDAAGMTELESRLDGASKVDIFLSDQVIDHDPILWHMNGSPTHRANPRAAYTYALRVGDYKLVKYEDHTSYRLFHVTNDPGEIINLASKEPARLESMIAQLHAMRRTTSRVPLLPEVVTEPITVPFDPRLDVSSGEMTLVFNLESVPQDRQSLDLFEKPESWRLTLQPDQSLLLEITGVDRWGVPMHSRLATQPLNTTSDHEIAVVFGGFKNDFTTVDLYVDQTPVASLDPEQRPWNIWSSTSSLRIGGANVRVDDIRMYLTRLWPEEWSDSTDERRPNVTSSTLVKSNRTAVLLGRRARLQ